MVTTDVKILIPGRDKQTKTIHFFEVYGKPITLTIGDRKIDFVMQRDKTGKLSSLTHRASGMKLGDLSLLEEIYPNQAAKNFINELIEKHGTTKILASMDRERIINNTENS